MVCIYEEKWIFWPFSAKINWGEVEDDDDFLRRGRVYISMWDNFGLCCYSGEGLFA